MHFDEDGKFKGQSDDGSEQSALLDVLSVVEKAAAELEDLNDPNRLKFAEELKQAIKALRRGLPRQ